ncbi:MAG TPA: YqgE/AlgH family protein [Cytophagales bacterium]|nr:YqgE/AlgH family protein [Cytophagales bacterium]
MLDDNFSFEKINKGDILISEPFLPDANFERSVILLCSHDETGSLGFVINKPSKVQINQVVESEKHITDFAYIGGPVEQNTLHFLHTLGDKIEGSLPVHNGIYWGGNFEQLSELIALKLINSTEYRFFLGYSGWSDGQLEEELKQKSWIISNKYNNDLFGYKSEDLWRIVLKDLGGKFKMISNYPLDPRLN